MKTVLIVDDAAFMRLSLKSIFEKNGFKVVGEADNGRGAISLYKRLKPDIVTMDIVMPGMDGIETLKEIKTIDKDAKVIMVSASGYRTVVKEAVIAGACSFIVKPIKEDVLIRSLKK